MARIRSIKPSFFTNEDLAELSFAHRLCFAGLWTQADREGRLEDRPRRLKAAIFPYDDIDMNALLTGLAEKQFIVRYAADGVAYIAVNGFLKHQRPKSDEPASVIAAPILENPRGIGAAPRIGNDRGQGTEDREERTGEVASADGALFGATAPAPQRPEDFQEAWNSETLPPLPRCRDLTTKRRRHIKARLTERPLTEWREVMQRIQASAFCRGEVAPREADSQPWVASFDWLIGSPDVAVKVLEGKYDDRSVPRRTQADRPFSERELSDARDWYRRVGTSLDKSKPAQEHMAGFIRRRRLQEAS